MNNNKNVNEAKRKVTITIIQVGCRGPRKYSSVRTDGKNLI